MVERRQPRLRNDTYIIKENVSLDIARPIYVWIGITIYCDVHDAIRQSCTPRIYINILAHLIVEELDSLSNPCCTDFGFNLEAKILDPTSHIAFDPQSNLGIG
jgi:hypothetical protein